MLLSVNKPFNFQPGTKHTIFLDASFWLHNIFLDKIFKNKKKIIEIKHIWLDLKEIMLLVYVFIDLVTSKILK